MSKDFKTSSRILEDIVPKEFKSMFSLINEDEPTFNFAASPKKTNAAPEPGAAGQVDPNAPPPDAAQEAPQETPPAGESSDGDKGKWLVKKMVGTLRYAGAMATEMRGALPEEAMEILDKLEKELEELSTALAPFTDQEEEAPPEEEPAPEENQEAPPEGAQPNNGEGNNEPEQQQ